MTQGFLELFGVCFGAFLNLDLTPCCGSRFAIPFHFRYVLGLEQRSFSVVTFTGTFIIWNL